MDGAIELIDVTKDYPLNLRGVRVRAVDRLCLTVPASGVFGLLGPNGGGKSTTIKLILGLIAPTAGTVRVFGAPAGSLEARRQIGYLPEAPQFPRFVTGAELVAYHARLGGLPRRGLEARVREVIAWVGLEGAAGRRIGTYSKGMLQRIGLAQALVHDPQLVILDEPSAGVDPVALAELSNLLLRLKREGKVIVITTHQLSSIDALCDRVAIMHRGRLVTEGAVSDLLASTDAGTQSLRVRALEPAVLADLAVWLEQRGSRLDHVATARAGLEEVLVRALTPAREGAGRLA